MSIRYLKGFENVKIPFKISKGKLISKILNLYPYMQISYITSLVTCGQFLHPYNIIDDNIFSLLRFWNYVILQHCYTPSTYDGDRFHLWKWLPQKKYRWKTNVFAMSYHIVTVALCKAVDVTLCRFSSIQCSDLSVPASKVIFRKWSMKTANSDFFFFLAL